MLLRFASRRRRRRCCGEIESVADADNRGELRRNETNFRATAAALTEYIPSPRADLSPYDVVSESTAV